MCRRYQKLYKKNRMVYQNLCLQLFCCKFYACTIFFREWTKIDNVTFGTNPAISACVLNTSYVQIVKELLRDKAWRQENVAENKKRKRSRFVDMIAETFLLSYYISDYKITFICNCWLIIQMAALILVIESLEQMSVVKNRSTFLKITVAKICKWENE